jgi:hypothetical protein
MKLSPHEVADLVIKAGFSKTTIVPGTTDTEAVVAVAVAFAESSADSESISRTTAPITSDPASIGQRDHGIFQLSGRWQYPKIQAAGGRWRDPVINTAAAYEIFKGAGRTFTSWSVFTKNASTGIAPYEQYLPDARLGVQQPWPYVDEELLAISKLSAEVAKVAASVVELNKAVAKLAELSTAVANLNTVVTEIRNHFK